VIAGSFCHRADRDCLARLPGHIAESRFGDRPNARRQSWAVGLAAVDAPARDMREMRMLEGMTWKPSCMSRAERREYGAATRNSSA
jgi:hypothetical protein